MNYFIIQDWIGNVLNFKGEFVPTLFAVDMEFKTFEDAEEYLVKLLGDSYEDDRQEYYIIECEE
jgi:hypothetical protein